MAGKRLAAEYVMCVYHRKARVWMNEAAEEGEK